ncbi:MAG: pentapeptide repeat-containing protein [Candidatus Dormibacteraeota bacterium]|nr:pentapeptide repeat-containing protein [Candidatus Dormibacteraeota bacterium]
MRGVTVRGGRFRGVSLAGQHFRLLHLNQVEFDECDLSNCEWELPLLDEVSLRGCRMTGFRLRGGRALDLNLSRCHGQYAQVENIELKGASFAECQFADSTFSRCRLDGAVFTECDLRNIVLSGSRLKGTDLRGSRIDGLRATLDDLSGAILDPRQAAAVLFGQAQITVLESGEAPPGTA